MRPTPLIDPDTCQACHRCAARQACRVRAIIQIEANELPVVEFARCLGCMICIPACPYGAVRKSANARSAAGGGIA